METQQKKVVIIDYQLGNLFSVNQACQTVGMNATISSSKEAILAADALILPGVGAFKEAMKNMHELDLAEPIRDAVAAGKPFFGVCLGQQLLFTESEEFGAGKGLDLLPGCIRRFPASFEGHRVKVPQIAWNTIRKHTQSWEQSALCELEENAFMYFVHSYYADPSDDRFILTSTNYDGIEYCSAVLEKNIFATQFHPEKSSSKGLTIYKNWASINNLL